MPAPERLHIAWNAADVYERGLEARSREPVAPEQIREVLERQRGKLFLLVGRVVGIDTSEVLLSIRGADESGLHVVNHGEPPFEGVYDVASEPPPYMSGDGDCVFELINTELIDVAHTVG
jgi:hypothetical protein